MLSVIRRQNHPQGVRRCVPRCYAAALPQTKDRDFVAAAPRPCNERRAAAHNHLSSIFCPPSSERGSSLLISLIILIILMLLGIAAMTTSDTQFKLAGNLQFENIALNNAEAAVAMGETLLSDGTTYKDPGLLTARNSSATPQYYPVGTLTSNPLTMTWSDSNSAQVDADDNQRYLIETMSLDESLGTSSQLIGGKPSSQCTKVNTYRIVSRGTGARNAVKFIESDYSVFSCSGP